MHYKFIIMKRKSVMEIFGDFEEKRAKSLLHKNNILNSATYNQTKESLKIGIYGRFREKEDGFSKGLFSDFKTNNKRAQVKIFTNSINSDLQLKMDILAKKKNNNVNLFDISFKSIAPNIKILNNLKQYIKIAKYNNKCQSIYNKEINGSSTNKISVLQKVNQYKDYLKYRSNQIF